MTTLPLSLVDSRGHTIFVEPSAAGGLQVRRHARTAHPQARSLVADLGPTETATLAAALAQHIRARGDGGASS